MVSLKRCFAGIFSTLWGTILNAHIALHSIAVQPGVLLRWPVAKQACHGLWQSRGNCPCLAWL